MDSTFWLYFTVVQLVKNPPAMWETWVWSLGWEAPLEKGKSTHCSILAWKIPWTIQFVGSQRVWHDWVTFTFTFRKHDGLFSRDMLCIKKIKHILVFIEACYFRYNQSLDLLFTIYIICHYQRVRGGEDDEGEQI